MGRRKRPVSAGGQTHPLPRVSAFFQQFGPALEAVTDRDSEQDYAGNHQLLVPGQLVSQETFRGR